MDSLSRMNYGQSADTDHGRDMDEMRRELLKSSPSVGQRPAYGEALGGPGVTTSGVGPSEYQEETAAIPEWTCRATQ